MNENDKDPIEEIRAYREAYAARFNFDLDAIGRDLREKQAKGGRKVVTLPPRRPKPIEKPPVP